MPLKSTKSVKKLSEQLKIYFVNLEILGSFDGLDSENVIDYATTRRQALAQFRNVVEQLDGILK